MRPAEMVEAAHKALASFVKNKETAAVLIDSCGDKAFCAGISTPTFYVAYNNTASDLLPVAASVSAGIACSSLSYVAAL